MLYQNNQPCLPLQPLNKLDDNEITFERFSGHYILAGFYRPHFGHFLMDCLSQIWALDHAAGDVDGILFLPFRPIPEGDEDGLLKHTERTQLWLETLGIEKPVHFVTNPVEVERVTMGARGIGLDKKSAGTSHFRRFIRSRNAWPPDDDLRERLTRKIYISRQGLRAGTGNIVGELALEETLRGAGYQIYSPQKHSLEHQLTTYREAKSIVAVEGSALHLPPYSISRHCEVMILSRRLNETALNESFGGQFRGFASVTPKVSCNIVSAWQSPGINRILFTAMTVIDFEKTYDDLERAGFLPKGAERHYPTAQDLSDTILNISRARKSHLMIHEWDKNLG